MQDIKQKLIDRYGYDLERTPDDIRPNYVRTERAIDSVPQAISCVLHADGFEDAIRNAVSLGGDSDTIAAIAGEIAEAAFGVPDDIRAETHRRIFNQLFCVFTNVTAQLKRSSIRIPVCRTVGRDSEYDG